MNEEEIKLLNKIEELPRELNIEIRGLILAEICLRKENQQLKEKQKEFIEWLNNIVNNLEKEQIKRFNHSYQYKLNSFNDILSKYKEIIGGKE